MAYIDIFVAPVPNANREQYKKHCAIAAKLFKEYGAKEVVQGWAMTCRKAKSRHSRWR